MYVANQKLSHSVSYIFLFGAEKSELDKAKAQVWDAREEILALEREIAMANVSGVHVSLCMCVCMYVLMCVWHAEYCIEREIA